MKKLKYLLFVFVFVLSTGSADAVMQSLNGLNAQNQTFTNDPNIRINSSGSVHTIQFINSLSVSKGGTGQKTLTAGQILFGDTAASISQSTELFWDRTNSRLGIGTDIPSNKLTVSGNMSIGAAYASISAPTNGLIIQGDVGIGNSAPAFKLDVTGQVNASGGLCIGGICKTDWSDIASGSQNYIAKFSSQNKVIKSQIFDNGTNVGIGTASPGSKFTVTGTIESTTGGFKFPDGTTQTTAAVSSPIKFGGTGTDGALNISSGTTTLDLGGSDIFIKNYSSISITGTGKLAFTNPHANGSVIVLKSQGDVTITCSGICIDGSGVGATGGQGAATQDGPAGYLGSMTVENGAQGGGGRRGSGSSTAGTAGELRIKGIYTQTATSIIRKSIVIAAGSGGGAGAGENNAPGGNGGNGGAGLMIEVGGSLNFTGSISLKGQNGGNGTATPFAASGGGGGGAGGMAILIYNALTINTGIFDTLGGSGGNGAKHANIGSIGGGGGGAGAYGGIGGLGGIGSDSGAGLISGGNAGGNSAGGGGGGATGSNSTPGTGGTGGSSNGGLVVQNTEF